MKGFKGSDLCLSSFQLTGSSQWRQNTLNCGDKPSFVLGRRLTAQWWCVTFDLCSCLCASGWSGSWQDASYKLQSGFRFSTQDSIPPSAARGSEDPCWRRWGITAATTSHQKIQNVPHIFIGSYSFWRSFLLQLIGETDCWLKFQIRRRKKGIVFSLFTH